MGSNQHEGGGYILAESREGEFVQTLLKDFKGVLVSDFYAAYVCNLNLPPTSGPGRFQTFSDFHNSSTRVWDNQLQWMSN